jgi:hypothetical protein
MVPWDEFQYTVYAREFNWTPDQVDNLPLDAEPWLLPISHAIDEELERRRVKAEAAEKARNARKGRRQ